MTRARFERATSSFGGSCDNLSNGRLTFGTPPGYVSDEFEAYGVDYADRFRLHEEIIDFIERPVCVQRNSSFTANVVAEYGREAVGLRP